MSLIIKPFVDGSGKLRLASFTSVKEVTPYEISKRSFESMDEVLKILNLIKNDENNFKYQVGSIKNLVVSPVAKEKLSNGYILEKKSVKSSYHTKNEDSVAILQNNNSDALLLIVCDGVGGIAGGEVASQFTVLQISKYFSNYDFNNYESKHIIINDFRAKISEISSNLINMGRNNPQTTLTMAIVLKDETLVFNVGDSRCYLINNSNKIYLVTKDHSVVWNNYIETGKLSVDDLRFAPSNNIILNAVGGLSSDGIDVSIIDNNIIKSLILCTDGVSDVLSSIEIASVICNNKNNFVDKIIDSVRNKKGYSKTEVSRSVSLFGSVKGNIKDDDASVVVLKKIKNL